MWRLAESTNGGSVDFFETVFPSTGLVSPYVPVAESGIYDKEQEFFAGQKVFADIAEYAKYVPAVKNGKFHYEAADAVAVAIQSSGEGADLKDELQLAQEEVEFKMEADEAAK